MASNTKTSPETQKTLTTETPPNTTAVPVVENPNPNMLIEEINEAIMEQITQTAADEVQTDKTDTNISKVTNPSSVSIHDNVDVVIASVIREVVEETSEGGVQGVNQVSEPAVVDEILDADPLRVASPVVEADSEKTVPEPSRRAGKEPVVDKEFEDLLNLADTITPVNPTPATPKVKRTLFLISDEETESVDISSRPPAKKRTKTTAPRRQSSRNKKPNTSPPPKPKANKNPTSVPVPSGKPKTILEEYLVDEKFLRDNHLDDIFSCIQSQGWEHLFTVDEPVDKELVSEFYQNIWKEEKGSLLYLHFSFRGQDLSISSKELACALGLKHEGYDEYVKKLWPESVTEKKKEEIMLKVCNFYDPNVKELSTNDMLPFTKILHRFLVTTILPRGSKTALSQIQDILVLYQMIKLRKINLSKLIIHQMDYMKQFSQIGHSRIVKKILEYHDLYQPTSETSVTKPLTLNNLHRWGIQYDEDKKEWIRKDMLETEVPEPTETQEEPSDSAARLQKVETEVMSIKKILLDLKTDLSGMRKEFADLRKDIQKHSSDPWIIEDELKTVKDLIKSEFAKLNKPGSSRTKQ